MKTQFDIEKTFAAGKIHNELELERALIAERKLRLLAREDPKFKVTRKKLRDLIEAYEKENWSGTSEISDAQFDESEAAVIIAEKERQFIEKRKSLIRAALKSFGLNQQDLGVILSHGSKSYMSELMNGVSPFSMKDLIIINRLLNIELTDLIPTFLPPTECDKVNASIEKLDKLGLNKSGFGLNC